MHTDDGAVQLGAEFGDGKGRGIGGEQALGFADPGQLLEGLLFDLHVLNSRFDDKIAVLADLLGAGGNLGEDRVGSGLLHLPLGHAAVQALGDLVFAARGKLFVDVTQEYLIAIGLGKSLSDAGTHGAGADNTNLHCSNLR